MIHEKKEIENFLLVASAIARAAADRVKDRVRRTGSHIAFNEDSGTALQAPTSSLRSDVEAAFLASRAPIEKKFHRKHSDLTINRTLINEFNTKWEDMNSRLEIVPGKEVMSLLNIHLQAKYQISLTPAMIINSMRREEVDPGMIDLMERLERFRSEPSD